MNSREKLAAAADWLGWQNEDLSFGLRTAKDALKLYEYAQKHADGEILPEMADEWTATQLRRVLGYNPLSEDAKHYDDGNEISAQG